MPCLCGYVRLGPRALAPAAALARMTEAVPPETAAHHPEVRLDAGERVVWTRQLTATDPQEGERRVLLDGYLLDRSRLDVSGVAAPLSGVAAPLSGVAAPCAGEASDAQLLRALFDTRGLAAFAQVDGDYNAALLGAGPVDLTVVGSRHGTRHLYYRCGPDYVAFSTRLRALAVLPGTVRVDELALQEMFNFGHLGGDRSLLRSVRLLPPGSALEVDAQGVRILTYWQPRYANSGLAPPFDALVDEAADRLTVAVDACRRRFGDRVAIPVSGGLDSRTILAFAAHSPPAPPAYHCAWYDGEARLARALAGAAGAAWHEYDPLRFDFAGILAEGSRLGEGNVHAHQFWFLPLARDLGADADVDVVLDGYLMDLFFGDTFLVLPKGGNDGAASRRAVVNRIWRRCHPRFVHSVFRPAFARAYEEANRASIDEEMGRIDEADLSNFIHRFSFANRSNRYSVAMPNVQRQHVEYAYPGLHRDVVDLYLRLPPRYKPGAAFARAVLARHAPAFAAVPWAKTGRALRRDKTVLDRLADRLPLRQLGSLSLLRLSAGRLDVTHRADLNRHFRRRPAFRRAFLDVADDERTYARGWIEPDGLRRLVRLVDRGWPVFFLLQCLVTVELFHRQVVDR